MVSQVASKIIDILDGISPIVITSIVFFAKLSAGLKCGKNFKAPNQTYTMPMVNAKI